MSCSVLTFLGCGELGTAILCGLQSSISSIGAADELGRSIRAFQNSKTSFDSPLTIRFIACVRSERSAARIRAAVGVNLVPVNVLLDGNIKGIEEADVIILGCKPHAAGDLLRAPGIAKALKGKLLISILGGVSIEDLEYMIDQPPFWGVEDRCTIVRVMPNTASLVGGSMTIMPPAPKPAAAVTTSIFSRIGHVRCIPENWINPAAALCASGPAFLAFVLDALVEGAVGAGISKFDALEMAAYTMRGTAELILKGKEPRDLTQEVATPGGATAKGLEVLNSMQAKEIFIAAFKETSDAMVGLGARPDN